MHTVFQIFLAAALLSIMIFMFHGGGSIRAQALRRLAFFIFAILTLFSIFIPSQLTTLAHYLGVGRGADLLLYGFIVFVFIFIANSFRHIKSIERNITVLARQIALDKKRITEKQKKNNET